ncbi:MAG: glycosyltransferase [Massilia sp.]|nr:glycosyltransferase [Massilia sp.]
MLIKSDHSPAQLAADARPVLLVIIDTEEEFAWDRPFDRASTGTVSIGAQPLMHEQVFDRFGIVPTYMCDYPVVSTGPSIATLRRLMEEGRCEIGTHLHPWVSPPHTEEVNRFNSYAGNLPPELEYEKLRTITAAITDNFGRAPTAFKAGRYGLGPSTAESIAALGYTIDASVVPYSAFRDDGGPDFRAFDEHPYWFGAGGRSLLELPVTTGYTGWLRSFGPHLFELAQQPAARKLRAGGVLARSRALERIRLSPEMASDAEMRRLTSTLRADGCQVFSLTYHSPSMAVGHTPYVRSADDLSRFIATVHDYCAWFRDEFGGQFMSLTQLRDSMAAQR